MFYHGTSTDLGLWIGDYLHPPIETGILRENWRGKLTDKVFFTSSPLSAMKFAKKAVERFGGAPIIFEVKPLGYYWNNNTNEYIADSAKIVGIHYL